MEHRVYNHFSPPPSRVEYNSGNQLTIPELSLTVEEIINLAMAGQMDIPMLVENADESIIDLRASDLTDVYPYTPFNTYTYDENNTTDVSNNTSPEETPSQSQDVGSIPNNENS